MTQYKLQLLLSLYLERRFDFRQSSLPAVTEQTQNSVENARLLTQFRIGLPPERLTAKLSCSGRAKCCWLLPMNATKYCGAYISEQHRFNYLIAYRKLG
jgi:hypothetical protein